LSKSGRRREGEQGKRIMFAMERRRDDYLLSTYVALDDKVFYCLPTLADGQDKSSINGFSQISKNIYDSGAFTL
jgi:hypothetical protein